MPEDANILDRQIQDKLAAAERQRQAVLDRVKNDMAIYEDRQRRFNEKADHLVKDIIRPAMRKLVAHFDHSRLRSADQTYAHQCVALFDHTARYPASVTLGFGVGHDDKIDQVCVTYWLEILPMFFQFDRHDEWVAPFDSVDELRLTQWVDHKILGFVDTYLRIEHTDQYQIGNLATDPVCGMRIHKGTVERQAEVGGHTYYFCTEDCLKKFTGDPSRYVSIE